MRLANKLKIFFLFAGDIVSLYLSLFVTLLVRYQGNFYNRFIDSHFLPFTIVFAIWEIIFYAAGLYDLHRLRNNLDFFKNLGLTLFISSIIAVFFFYLIPVFGITPKTNLLIFVVVFAVIELSWRRYFNNVASSGEAANKILLVNSNETAKAVDNFASQNPQLGYEIKIRLGEKEIYSNPQVIQKIALDNKINLVVIPRHLKNNPDLANALYGLLNRGIEVRDLTNFYELVERKVPLADLEEAWFLENFINQQKFYDKLKMAAEFLAALIIGIFLLPLLLIITALIKLTSKGPVLIRQQRIGETGGVFILLKFRTMVALAPDGQAETSGAKWSKPGDERVTTFGRFLRYTHLDELPQLINIIKGELSFVGPRPERPEFVKILREKITYYEIRHLVKPGVTGWAQINYRYGASVEDAYEKLQYDIYYIKNRSIVLDLAIILKTIKSFFINPE